MMRNGGVAAMFLLVTRLMIPPSVATAQQCPGAWPAPGAGLQLMSVTHDLVNYDHIAGAVRTLNLPPYTTGVGLTFPAARYALLPSPITSALMFDPVRGQWGHMEWSSPTMDAMCIALNSNTFTLIPYRTAGPIKFIPNDSGCIEEMPGCGSGGGGGGSGTGGGGGTITFPEYRTCTYQITTSPAGVILSVVFLGCVTG